MGSSTRTRKKMAKKTATKRVTRKELLDEAYRRGFEGISRHNMSELREVLAQPYEEVEEKKTSKKVAATKKAKKSPKKKKQSGKGARCPGLESYTIRELQEELDRREDEEIQKKLDSLTIVPRQECIDAGLGSPRCICECVREAGNKLAWYGSNGERLRGQ